MTIKIDSSIFWLSRLYFGLCKNKGHNWKKVNYTKVKMLPLEDFINPKLDFASVKKKIMFVKIKSIH